MGEPTACEGDSDSDWRADSVQGRRSAVCEGDGDGEPAGMDGSMSGGRGRGSYFLSGGVGRWNWATKQTTDTISSSRDYAC